MTRSVRPQLKELFFSAKRIPEVYFYTSNIEKFLQARAVFLKNSLLLKHYRRSTEPYEEDYEMSKDALLATAIKEIRISIGAVSLFFVEDTSIRIDALSSDDADFPGLAAKEWFGSTTFEDLDRQLRECGNNRAAVVKSDIGLHVPNLDRPVFFHGETTGSIANSPPSFSASVQHPWLTPSTFNGWLIPSNARKRLGEMSFEESWRYDFRVAALSQLIDRLEEYTAALNLASNTYSRRRDGGSAQQLHLIPPKQDVFVIVGRTCAGKTTMADELANYGFRCIEASSVVRSFKDSFGEGEETDFEFAKRTLGEKGSDAVARKIISLVGTDIQERLAISGFRTIEELECIMDKFPHVRTILIEATERTRFERYLQRGRSVEDPITLDRFRKRDREQWNFGLLRVAEEFAHVRITNEGTMSDFLGSVQSLAGGESLEDKKSISENIGPRRSLERNQLFRCLEILESAGRPMDCGEIEKRTKGSNQRIRHNNANKVLKRVPELVKRMELERSRVRYHILDAGRAYVRVLRQFSRDVAENGKA